MSSMGKVDEPYVDELADGILAYIQPDGISFLNNTGIVIGPDAVVIDHVQRRR